MAEAGLKVALTVLMFERLAISGHARGFGVGIAPLIEAVKEADKTQDPVVRRRSAGMASVSGCAWAITPRCPPIDCA